MRYRQFCGKLLPTEAEAGHVIATRVLVDGAPVVLVKGCQTCRDRPLLTPEDQGVKWWTPRVGHIRPGFTPA